jgi:hypothetical protein
MLNVKRRCLHQHAYIQLYDPVHFGGITIHVIQAMKATVHILMLMAV